MSARMHDTCFRTIPDGAHLALEGHIGFLDNRQAVHIRTQRHAGAGMGTFEHADHAGVGNLFFDIVEAQLSQVIRNQFAGTKFAIAQFWIGVEVASPGNDLFVQAVGVLRNGGVAREESVWCIHSYGSLVQNDYRIMWVDPNSLPVRGRYND